MRGEGTTHAAIHDAAVDRLSGQPAAERDRR